MLERANDWPAQVHPRIQTADGVGVHYPQEGGDLQDQPILRLPQHQPHPPICSSIYRIQSDGHIQLFPQHCRPLLHMVYGQADKSPPGLLVGTSLPPNDCQPLPPRIHLPSTRCLPSTQHHYEDRKGGTRSTDVCFYMESFSMEYFFNKGLLYMDGPDVCFYDVGKVETQVKKEMDGIEAVVSVDYEELRKEMEEMREELGGVRVEIQALKGRITDLVGKSSAQSDRMAEAVKIMMRMADWLDNKFPQTQQRLPLGPGNAARQPGQGSSSLQRPPSASKPVVTPSVSRPLAPVSVRKPVSKQPMIEEEEPASPARKKVKTNCPSVPPKSGSRGGQTHN